MSAFSPYCFYIIWEERWQSFALHESWSALLEGKEKRYLGLLNFFPETREQKLGQVIPNSATKFMLS